jgi:hypothetical protein
VCLANSPISMRRSSRYRPEWGRVQPVSARPPSLRSLGRIRRCFRPQDGEHAEDHAHGQGGRTR